MKNDPRSCERNLCMQLRQKPEKKFKTLRGFQPLTSRYRCDALTNRAMKPPILRAGPNIGHAQSFGTT